MSRNINKLIGFVNDCGINEDEIELGYAIDPVFLGRGYATEAVKAAIIELKEMGFKKVVAGYFEGNEESRTVMEKCGMKPNTYTDVIEYRGEKHTCFYCDVSF